jgi:hypothetical protein
MEVLQFAPGMTAEVARRYNDLVAEAPRCHPVAQDEFACGAPDRDGGLLPCHG